MDLYETFNQYSLIWLLLTTIVALISGFVSSWLYYIFIRRKELEETKKLELEQSKKERIASEIIKWANPIHLAVQGLCYRLRIILHKGGYVALKGEFSHPQWSIKYEYYMNSTLFFFGRYFAMIELLKEELNIEIFHSHKEKDEFFLTIIDVGKTLNKYPPGYSCNGQDIQIFSLQQTAIGEVMIKRDGNQKRCMNYVEFLEAMKNPDFFVYFLPLKNLIDGIDRDKPDHDCRWKRLLKLHEKLIQLNSICEKKLSISPSD
jgi:hypothetical protein